MRFRFRNIRAETTCLQYFTIQAKINLTKNTYSPFCASKSQGLTSLVSYILTRIKTSRESALRITTNP